MRRWACWLAFWAGGSAGNEEEEEEEGGGDYRVIRNDKGDQGRDAMSMSRLPAASHVLPLASALLGQPAVPGRPSRRPAPKLRPACPAVTRLLSEL